MISQAWARRRYKAVFVSKVDEALGEASETQSWLDDALTVDTSTRLDLKRWTVTGVLSEQCLHE